MLAADLIGGESIALKPGGLVSENPARPDEVVWQGRPEPGHVGRAVAAARGALAGWWAMGPQGRAAALRAFAAACKSRAAELAGLLCRETGKAMWECEQEVGLLASKVEITLDPQAEQNWGMARVRGYELAISPTRRGRAWFRPHGVMAVLGPFNFPLHLPNGHIVPALAMGNTVVFKPSDKAPACGQRLIELLDGALRGAGAPAGVVNLVHGDGVNAAALAADPGVDGVLFTGSWPVGRRIMEANLDRPHRLIALEMGGNNAAVVMPDADLRQAVIETVRSAFNTAGQRCTCTRRLIVHREVADRVIGAVARAAGALSVGDPLAAGTFMGPVITARARAAAVEFERLLGASGGEVLVSGAARGGPVPGVGHYVGPSVVVVPRFTAEPAPQWGGGGASGGEGVGGAGFDCGCDEEVFGPVLRVAVVGSLEEGIEQANATRYGLAASIFTREASAAERFMATARAGCINVNCGTAGASSKLPFGGLGLSGNHRPAGAYSLDYCGVPVAGMHEVGDAAVLAPGMVFEDRWIG